VAWTVPDTAAKCWYTCAGSSAAVVGGVVYQSTAYGVVARDAATGALRWRAPLGTNTTVGTGPRLFRVFPAVADGIVLAGFGMQTSGGHAAEDTGVAALSTATGQTLWTLKTGSRVPARNLTLAGGVLYVDVDKLYAVTARTGHVLWSRPNFTAPAVAGDRVYAISESGDGDVAALSTTTGRTLWTYRQPRGIYGPTSVMVVGRVVYAGIGLHVVELNARTGKPEKSLATGCLLTGPGDAALAHGVVYVICGGQPDRRAWAEAISTTGKRLWRRAFGAPGGAILATPIVANGVTYLESFANRSGKTAIDAVGATSGQTLWTRTLPIRTWSQPTVAEGRLFASLTTGMTVFAITPNDRR
jgi:outer membrane protein assembly factor BamB